MLSKVVALVCPVYNEQDTLKNSTDKLIEFATSNLQKYKWYVCIVDNASTDNTMAIATSLADKYKRNFKYKRLKDKGKGLAIRTAWMEEDFDYSIYMDIDLSTDINAILPTISLLEEGVDVVIGSRKSEGSKVINRPIKREFTSVIYIAIANILSSIPKVTDFQCGFKGISKQTAMNVLPSIVDNTWYFDSELIINSHKLGYNVQEIPVVWTDDPSTTVKIKKVSQVLLLGLYRNLSEKSWLAGGKVKDGQIPTHISFFDHFIESLKFLSVGMLCFFIDLIIAFIFQYIAPDILGTFNFFGRTFEVKDIYVAVSLGFILSVPINFYLNRVFTFQKVKDSIYQQLLKFLPVLILGIIIKIISAFVWTDILGLYKVLAVPFSSIIMLITNYIGHKFFTFKSPID